jgi:hypothetical protein
VSFYRCCLADIVLTGISERKPTRYHDLFWLSELLKKIKGVIEYLIPAVYQWVNRNTGVKIIELIVKKIFAVVYL